ncbi:MAG TPA: MlaD family protein [Stellaceae bacterium]|jgi:phospholipid/cholesterol/gamma-HCH transport system substrate-binding protein|nr:MlaD family protein [Stellaceae bacterium]
METRANYVAVGAFVLVLLVGVLVAALWIAGVEFNRERAFYDIYFNGSVTGLARGSQVLYNGIPIGRAEEIRIDPQNLEQVRVTIEVDQAALIRSDAVASLEFQGLTGSAYIEITGGSQSAPILVAQPGQRYPVIPSRPSGLQRVFASAPEVLARLADIADKLSGFLDEHNRVAVAETLDNVRRLTGAAAAHADDLGNAMSDTAAAMRDLHSTLDTANATLLELRQLIGPGGDAQDALRGIDAASQRLGKLSADLDSLVQETRPPLRNLSQNGLPQLSQLLIDTRTLVGELTRLTEEIERDPTRFFFGGQRREGYQPP